MTRHSRVDPAVRPRIQSGRDIRAHQYLAALAERDRMKADFLAALDRDGIDALLTPTTQTAAIPNDAVDQNTTPAHSFTRVFNLLEMCARSPCRAALPRAACRCRSRSLCRPYDEAMALRIGWAYQQATDWHTRRPPGFGG